MATMEMKLAIARLVHHFADIRIENHQTHRDMEMTDHFTLIPRGRRCRLVFCLDGDGEGEDDMKAAL
jgi:hypothetical protein